MKKLLFFYLFLCVLKNTNAQPDFRKGFVVKTNGDTLLGTIDFQSDKNLSKQCVFRAENQRKTTVFKPEDLKSYLIKDNKYLVSKTLGNNKYFLEVLIDGKLDLYYLPIKRQDKFYIEKDSSPIKEIYYRDTIINVNGRQYQERTQSHLAILSEYTEDVQDFNNQVLQIKTPNETNLANLAKNYHKAVCKEYDCVQYKRKSLLNVGIEPFAGRTSIAKYTASADPYNYVQKNFFTRGIFVNFWAGRRNERFFFRTGYYETNIQYNDGFKEKLITIPFQVGYIFPKTYKIRPTISVDLLHANYFGGVQFHILKRLDISIYANAKFVSPEDAALKIIPRKFFSSSIFGGLAFNF